MEAVVLIISNEQVERCMRYLREGNRSSSRLSASVTPEQLSKIKAYLQRVPEVREPIVARLRGALPTYDPDSREIAEKMVGRLIGDMLR